MHTFVALYWGQTISDARLAGATADRDLVSLVVDRLLGRRRPDRGDPVIAELEHGRNAALKAVAAEQHD